LDRTFPFPCGDSLTTYCPKRQIFTSLLAIILQLWQNRLSFPAWSYLLNIPEIALQATRSVKRQYVSGKIWRCVFAADYSACCRRWWVNATTRLWFLLRRRGVLTTSHTG